MASRTDAPLKGLRAAARDTESPVAELDLSPKRTVCRRGLGSPRPQQLGCLHRSNSQRRKARRSAGPAADQVRTGDQPQGSQGARSRSAGEAIVHRRRGDRMRRRDFVASLSVAVAWPLAARAQAADNRVHRDGHVRKLDPMDGVDTAKRVTSHPNCFCGGA